MMNCVALARSLAGIALFMGLAAGAAVAERNEAIAAAAEAQVPAVLETIRSLAAIESGSGNADGLAEVAAQLEQRFLALEFTITRHTSPVDIGADTIVAVKAGSGRQNVMLIAHMDTVFEAGTLATMPVRMDGGRLYGPGVVDDKGGIAIILHSLQMLADQGWDDYASLTVLLNPDEETGSAGSGALISDLAAGMDTVLSFEVGGSDARGMAWVLAGTATYAQVTMKVTGIAAHAGSDPGRGRNAIIELAHQLLATRDVADGVPGAQLNWTNVVSDKAFNQIPDLAVATGDARITLDGADDQLLAALRNKILEDSLIPNTETTVSLEILRPGFKANRDGMAVARLAQRIYGEVASQSFYIVPMVMGATDAGYAAGPDGVAVLEGFGPSGAGYHSPTEYLDVASIKPTLYQVTRLLMELGKTPVE